MLTGSDLLRQRHSEQSDHSLLMTGLNLLRPCHSSGSVILSAAKNLVPPAQQGSELLRRTLG